MNISKASLHAGSSEEEILPKSVVPVRAFQPDFLFRISSACFSMSCQSWDSGCLWSEVRTVLICISLVLLGLGFPASCVKWNIKLVKISTGTTNGSSRAVLPRINVTASRCSR